MLPAKEPAQPPPVLGNSASPGSDLSEADRQGSSQMIAQLIMTVGPNDVLVGRGAPSNANEGNKRFRELVKQRKADYTNTKKRQAKDQVAKDIFEIIAKRDGKFLRKVESPTEAKELGVSDKIEVWLLVPPDIAIRKTKQALRDKEITMLVVEEEGNFSEGPSKKLPYSVDSRFGPGQDDMAGATGNAFSFSELVLLQQKLPVAFSQHHRSELGGSFNEQLSTSLSDGRSYPGCFNNSASMNPAIASLFLSQSQLPARQNNFDLNLPSFSSTDALLNTLGSAYPNSDLLKALALRQSLVPHEQQQLTLDSSISQRLLAMNGMQTIDPASIQTSQLLDAHIQVSTAQTVDHPPAPTSLAANGAVRGQTRAEKQIELALYQRQSSDVQLAVTKSELNILRVLTCHGLPVWTRGLEVGSNNLAAETAFAWSDFASHFIELSDEEDEGLSSTVNGKQTCQDIAERVVMLIAKLMTVATGFFDGARADGNGNKSDLNLSLWFHAELDRWAAGLGIMDDSCQRPIAFSTVDLVELPPAPQVVAAAGLVGGLTKDACGSIISQAAHVTRLRSVDIKNPQGLDEKVGQVHRHLASSAQSVRRLIMSDADLDLILLEGILEMGFSGDLLNQIVPQISQDTAQAHMENMIACLHALQAANDRETIVGKHKAHLLERLQGIGSPKPLKKHRTQE